MWDPPPTLSPKRLSASTDEPIATKNWLTILTNSVPRGLASNFHDFSGLTLFKTSAADCILESLTCSTTIYLNWHNKT